MARLTVESMAFRYPYRGAPAVFERIDLSVDGGESLMLLGPNGTGKSTLLKCMAGLLRPCAGRVRLDGEEVRRIAPRRLARRVGYVPQSSASAFPFLVRDIVVMGRAPHLSVLGSPSPEDCALAGRVLAGLGIAHLAGRTCHQVSAGEWQMTLIARALAQQPDVLLLDEPTAHLDLANQVRILDTVRSLAARGLAIVMATHAPDQAFMAADTVAILQGGSLLASGPPRAVLTSDTLRRAYGVDVEVIELGGAVRRSVCAPILSDQGGAAGRKDRVDGD